MEKIELEKEKELEENNRIEKKKENFHRKSINEKNFSEMFGRIKTKLNFDFEKKITNLNKKENIDKFPFVTSKFCN